MFNSLYKNPVAAGRHNAAPWCKERESYLEHLARAGYTRKALTQTAACLLRVTRDLKISSSFRVSSSQIRNASCRTIKNGTAQPSSGRSWTQEYFIQVATQWLRFLGWLSIPPKKQTIYENQLRDFLKCENCERGISSRTLETQERHIRTFLNWYECRKRKLSNIKIADVDSFLALQGRKRWSRRTIAAAAHSLRSLFRHGARRGWCSPVIADGIEGPRIYSQETLPAGPGWEQVQSITTRMNTDHPSDIRDRAIIMLLAIYGLRASEVAQLHLRDIDWDNERIVLRRVKNHQTSIAPLVPVVGDALIRYLKEVRPRCAFQEMFLKLQAPLGPISRWSIYLLTRKQFLAHGIKTAHVGPHSLRHACATHLLSEGFSYKEIGAHLGHRGTSATQIYAKVDMPHLRQVADLDLGGLL